MHTNLLAGLAFIQTGVIFATLSAPGVGGRTATAKPIGASELLQMTESQPDHVADIALAIDDTHTFTHLYWKLARKKNKLRKEIYPTDRKSPTTINRDYRIFTLDEQTQSSTVANATTLGLLLTPPSLRNGQQSLAFDIKAKTYAEVPDGIEFRPLDSYRLLKDIASDENAVRIEEVGTVVTEGHDTRKIRVSFRRGQGEHDLKEQGEVLLYFATDLKNLLIKLELESDWSIGAHSSFHKVHVVYTLSNVLLDVPDELFQLPTGYRKLEFPEFSAAAQGKR